MQHSHNTRTVSLHLPTDKTTPLCVINQVKYPENSTPYRLLFWEGHSAEVNSPASYLSCT